MKKVEIIGRSKELKILENQLTKNLGALTYILGEAGVGKTTLLRNFLIN